VRLKPAHCQVDLALKELQLTPLEKSGSAWKIPLTNIKDIQLGRSGYSVNVGEIALDLILGDAPSSGGALQPTKKLRVAAGGEESASSIWAALNASHRTAPGDMLATPQSSRSPSEKGN